MQTPCGRWWKICLFFLLVAALVEVAMLWLWYPPFREQVEDFWSDVELRLEDYLWQMASPRHAGCFRPIWSFDVFVLSLFFFFLKGPLFFLDFFFFKLETWKNVCVFVFKSWHVGCSCSLNCKENIPRTCIRIWMTNCIMRHKVTLRVLQCREINVSYVTLSWVEFSLGEGIRIFTTLLVWFLISCYQTVCSFNEEKETSKS